MSPPRVKFYAGTSRTTIAKCQIYLAVFNDMKLNELYNDSVPVGTTPNVRETLDKTGISAILALGYEEC
jgi:hypothetical protein